MISMDDPPPSSQYASPSAANAPLQIPVLENGTTVNATSSLNHDTNGTVLRGETVRIVLTSPTTPPSPSTGPMPSRSYQSLSNGGSLMAGRLPVNGTSPSASTNGDSDLGPGGTAGGVEPTSRSTPPTSFAGPAPSQSSQANGTSFSASSSEMSGLGPAGGAGVEPTSPTAPPSPYGGPAPSQSPYSGLDLAGTMGAEPTSRSTPPTPFDGPPPSQSSQANGTSFSASSSEMSGLGPGGGRRSRTYFANGSSEPVWWTSAFAESVFRSRSRRDYGG